jgi:type II restriction enzyme
MAKREDLRRTRAGTIINVSSLKMEGKLLGAMLVVVEMLEEKFGLTFEHDPKIYLSEITAHLRRSYPEIEFKHFFETSYLLPDGGILSIVDREGHKHVVLISEAKRQGTNDLRALEGLPKQAKGNAIERLGKNLIGLRAWLSTENILPFVVFGEGVDFDDTSSILDRVSTLAMFAPLNQIEVANQGDYGRFNRGSFFFRVEPWTKEEMIPVLYDIAERSIYYYFSKLGESAFDRKNPNDSANP